MPPTTPTSSHVTPATRPPAELEPHCVLEVWDTGRRMWTVDTVGHRTIAEATAAASERGVYRVVLVSHEQRLEVDVFAVIAETARATEPRQRETRTKDVGSSGHIR